MSEGNPPGEWDGAASGGKYQSKKGGGGHRPSVQTSGVGVYSVACEQ